MTGRREELVEQVRLFFRAFRRRESRRSWIALILSVLLSLMIEHYWDSLALGERGAIGRAFSTVSPS
jgi:hypothetical protein